MRRLAAPGIVVPLLLAVAGVALILAGSLRIDEPGPTLSGIPDPTSPVAVASATPRPPSPGISVEPTPSATPIPDDRVATQLEIASVDINVAVKHAVQGQCGFPPDDAAYVLCQSLEPGHGGNSYIVGHALQHLFKRLWNVVLGAEVKILMSDGEVLTYVVTEVHPNVSCPDSRNPPMPDPPLALIHAAPGCPGAAWIRPTDYERLTLQTSQGFNRNYGELVIVAEPI